MRITFGSLGRGSTWAGAVAATACIALAAGCGSSSSGSSDGKAPLKIGANLELTGALGSVGADSLKGLKLAVKLKNDDGGLLGNPVELDSQDNESVPASAVSVATKFGGDQSYNAIVGPIAAAATAAVAPIAEKYKIVTYNPAGAGFLPPSVYNGWVFRIREAQATAVGPTAKAVIDKLGNVKTVAILNYSDNDAYVQAKDIWEKTAKGMGISNIVDVAFPSKTQDYAPIVTKLQDQNVDVIFIGASPETDGPLIKALRNAGIDAPIVGDGSIFDPSTFEVSGGAVTGSYSYSDYLPDASNPLSAKFSSAYKKMTGREPSAYAAYAYDVANTLFAAVDKAKSTDRTKIRDALASLQDHKGLTGVISYDTKGGDPIRTKLTLAQVTSDGTLKAAGEIPVPAN